MDLPSDSDESDVDFVPDEEITKSDVDSEAEADKETEDQYEEALSKKRSKASATSCNKPMKKAKLDEDEVSESPKENKNSAALDPEQAKKYEEDLWASFLTPTQSKNSEPSQEKSIKESKSTEQKKDKDGPGLDPKFTPEEKEKPINTTSSKDLIPGRSRVAPPVPVNKKPVGGLASIISKIGKKDKLSTLERSKLDWMSYKKEEGLEEEIQTHNRGKGGYLERQDFLQRTDHRQYEIEKSLRLNKRSSR